MNIFVAKLNFRTTSEELYSLFEQFGEVTSAKVIMDHETGRSKGFGFVEMANDDEATNAINTLNDTEFHERTIVVKVAIPQERRSNFNQGGGNFHRGGGNRYNNRY